MIKKLTLLQKNRKSGKFKGYRGGPEILKTFGIQEKQDIERFRGNPEIRRNEKHDIRKKTGPKKSGVPGRCVN